MCWPSPRRQRGGRSAKTGRSSWHVPATLPAPGSALLSDSVSRSAAGSLPERAPLYLSGWKVRLGEEHPGTLRRTSSSAQGPSSVPGPSAVFCCTLKREAGHHYSTSSAFIPQPLGPGTQATCLSPRRAPAAWDPATGPGGAMSKATSFLAAELWG